MTSPNFITSCSCSSNGRTLVAIRQITNLRYERRNRVAVRNIRADLTGNLKQFCLISRRRLYAQFLVTQLRRHAALRGAVEVAFHDEIRLIDLLNRVRLLAHGHGERIHADRPAAEFHDDGFEDAFVHFIQAVLVNFQHRQRAVSDFLRNAAVVPDLRVIANAPEQVVDDARCAAAATGDFMRAGLLNFDLQQTRRAEDDFLQIVADVIIQPFAHAESA